MSDDKVVPFQKAGPRLCIKADDRPAEHRMCRHNETWVWAESQILQCSRCEAILDPYAYLRDMLGEWDSIKASLQYEVDCLKREKAEAAKALRLLKEEYRDEQERRREGREICRLPPSALRRN